MSGLWRRLRLPLLAAAGALYLALSYLASASEHPPAYAVALSSAPLLLGAGLACWASPLRYPATAAYLGALAAVVWQWDALQSHTAWLYFAQHAGAMASLALMFGSTLSTHESALCSRIARVAVAEEALDARYMHYTWQVTLAWTLYFVASLLISTALFAWGPLDVWAFFAAVLTPVTLGLMFGGEYLIRLRALPGRAHFSIAQTIQSYRKYTQTRASSR